jgi:colicin import membrane protein
MRKFVKITGAALATVGVVGLLSACAVGTTSDTAPATPDAATTESYYEQAKDKLAADEETTEDVAVAEPVEEEVPVEEQWPASSVPAETAGQENARLSAESYLDTMAFSRSGLIDQLKYEGYSTKDATYAVDAVSPNWNEQAAKAAKDYLDSSSFSRSGLIEQLEYEGYTKQEAVYGVNQAGLSAETAGQENARESAEDYLDSSAFSRKGLIDQLEYEGYSTKDATYAVDAVSVNWNQQAALAAQDYFDTMPFSRSGLIDQLEYEGYTEQQAVYGVNQTGL